MGLRETLEANERVPDEVTERVHDDIPIPPDLPPEVERIFQIGNAGFCMTCERELGETTVAKFDHTGLAEVYCSQMCAKDMAVLGWLSDTHSEIRQQIEMRGSEGFGG